MPQPPRLCDDAAADGVHDIRLQQAIVLHLLACVAGEDCRSLLEDLLGKATSLVGGELFRVKY
jgi:hypothetical protein